MPVIGYYNGQFVDPAHASVPIDERGHEFGDGVYEVIRVYQGQLFLLEWHIERLLNSLSAIRITSPYDAKGYEALIREALARSKEQEASIYLQVTRGAAIRNHLFPEAATPAALSLVVRPIVPHADVTKLGKLLLQPDERWANAYIKTINLLPNILAKQTAHDAGADEALLVRDGRMVEASSSNLWFVRDGVLITAPADRFILPGITRRFVIELARQMEIPVREQKLPLAELESVDAIFLTGTTTEVLPVDSVLTHPDIVVSETLSTASPHPLHVQPDECTIIWRARNLELVYQLKQVFKARVEEICHFSGVSSHG